MVFYTDFEFWTTCCLSKNFPNCPQKSIWHQLTPYRDICHWLQTQTWYFVPILNLDLLFDPCKTLRIKYLIDTLVGVLSKNVPIYSKKCIWHQLTPYIELYQWLQTRASMVLCTESELWPTFWSPLKPF